MSVTVICLALYALLNKKPIPSPLPLFMGLLLMPLLIVISLYTGSAIMHLCVLLFGGKGGFKGTFNVLAYNTATSIFNIIPFIGGLISAVWAIVVGVIGFKRIHNLSTARAVFAYCGLPFTVVAILALMAAIAIPNLLRARLAANESAAKATIITISTAIETYATQNNGQYPKDEYDLRFSSPPYLTSSYNDKTVQGYIYSLNLNPNGYEVVARPSVCGSTGNKIFTARTNGITSQEECRR